MSNPKTDLKVQVRDLLQVKWSEEQWEKLVALLSRKAQNLEQASNQTNSPEPLGISALKSQTPSGPEGRGSWALTLTLSLAASRRLNFRSILA